MYIYFSGVVCEVCREKQIIKENNLIKCSNCGHLLADFYESLDEENSIYEDDFIKLS